MEHQNVVGLAYTRIVDAIQRGLKDRMLIVDFKALTHSPQQTLDAIYDFFGEARFHHNYGHVEQFTSENDHVHGYFEMHRIKRRVEPISTNAAEVLGKALVQKYSVVSNIL